MFKCEIWFLDWYFPQFCTSDMSKYNVQWYMYNIRSTDISKCFRGSLRLRDNESRLYLQNAEAQTQKSGFAKCPINFFNPIGQEIY